VISTWIASRLLFALLIDDATAEIPDFATRRTTLSDPETKTPRPPRWDGAHVGSRAP
jgi:hypothetical protein